MRPNEIQNQEPRNGTIPPKHTTPQHEHDPYTSNLLYTVSISKYFSFVQIVYRTMVGLPLTSCHMKAQQRRVCRTYAVSMGEVDPEWHSRVCVAATYLLGLLSTGQSRQRYHIELTRAFWWNLRHVQPKVLAFLRSTTEGEILSAQMSVYGAPLVNGWVPATRNQVLSSLESGRSPVFGGTQAWDRVCRCYSEGHRRAHGRESDERIRYPRRDQRSFQCDALRAARTCGSRAALPRHSAWRCLHNARPLALPRLWH